VKISSVLSPFRDKAADFLPSPFPLIPLDENTQLLGSANRPGSSYYTGSLQKSKSDYSDPVSPFITSGNEEPSHQHNHKPDPVFPTRLNPVLPEESSKLGVVSGVFVPCVLSIWGIILFLRFGFIIGQTGVIGTLGMFIVGYFINIFTTLSLSAISTNGTVRGKKNT
jgi:hypothetical protein